MTAEEQAMAAKIHSVNFYVKGNNNAWVELNSFGDFHLIPSKMPTVVPKSPDFAYVSVPGSLNGDVDMTEALTGSTRFKNREGEWEFFYETPYRYALESHVTGANLLTPFQIQALLETNLQGKQVIAVLMDNSGVAYDGRVWCESFTPGEDSNSSVILKYKFKPETTTPPTT